MLLFNILCDYCRSGLHYHLVASSQAVVIWLDFDYMGAFILTYYVITVGRVYTMAFLFHVPSGEALSLLRLFVFLFFTRLGCSALYSAHDSAARRSRQRRDVHV